MPGSQSVAFALENVGGSLFSISLIFGGPSHASLGELETHLVGGLLKFTNFGVLVETKCNSTKLEGEIGAPNAMPIV